MQNPLFLNIYGTLQEQKETIKVFIQIEQTRNHMKKNTSYLEGTHARTLAHMDLFYIVQVIHVLYCSSVCSGYNREKKIERKKIICGHL